MTPTLPLPAHLLVVLPRPLGDAVLATPALRALRAALPGRRITWAGGRAALQALEGLPWRDAVMPVVGPFAHGLLAPWRAGRLWRRAGPDTVLLLRHAAGAVLAARASGAPRRVGSGQGGLAWLLTRRVTLPLEGGRLQPRSMVRMYLDLAAPLGARDDGRPPEVQTSAHDRWRATRRLATAARGARLLVVSPGAAFGATKVYPPALLAAAVRRARQAADLLPLVVCGPGEEALAQAVVEATGPPALSTHLAPPDVGELKGLLAQAAVCLATDAGPRHLAEALGVPSVVVMGPTDPRWTEGRPAVVVRNTEVPCLGCHRTRCPIGHPCMEALDPTVVADAVLGALAAPRAAPAGG